MIKSTQPKSKLKWARVQGLVVDVALQLDRGVPHQVVLAVGGNRRRVRVSYEQITRELGPTPTNVLIGKLLGTIVHVEGYQRCYNEGAFPSVLDARDFSIVDVPQLKLSDLESLASKVGLGRVYYRYRRYPARMLDNIFNLVLRDRVRFLTACVFWYACKGYGFPIPAVGLLAGLDWYFWLRYEQFTFSGQPETPVIEALEFLHRNFHFPFDLDVTVRLVKKHFTVDSTNTDEGSSLRYLPWSYSNMKDRFERMLKEVPVLEAPLTRDLQELAKTLIENKGVYVITGPGGTGKTTLVQELTRVLHHEHLHYVCLYGSTGKAAVRLGGITFARAMELKYGGHYAKNEYPQTAKVIFVDESGKLSLRDLYQALKARKHDQTLVFVGDPEQTPPVTGEDAFKTVVEILETKGRVLKLTTTYRFSPDRENWLILVPDAIGAIYALACCIRKCEEEGLSWLATTAYVQGKLGVKSLNPKIQRALRAGVDPLAPHREVDKNLTKVNIEDDVHTFSPGDRLTCLRNVYPLEETPWPNFIVPNGEVVTLVDLPSEDGTMTVRIFDHHEVRVPVNAFRLGYVNTYDKVQGLEADACFIVVPTDDRFKGKNGERLLNMLLGRARKRTIIVAVERTTRKFVEMLKKIEPSCKVRKLPRDQIVKIWKSQYEKREKEVEKAGPGCHEAGQKEFTSVTTRFALGAGAEPD